MYYLNLSKMKISSGTVTVKPVLYFSMLLDPSASAIVESRADSHTNSELLGNPEAGGQTFRPETTITTL